MIFYFDFLLNKLGKVDQTFFGICIGVVVLIIAFYFLIPVINRKHYKQMRDNLKERETSFKGQIANSEKVEVEVVDD